MHRTLILLASAVVAAACAGTPAEEAPPTSTTAAVVTTAAPTTTSEAPTTTAESDVSLVAMAEEFLSLAFAGDAAALASTELVEPARAQVDGLIAFYGLLGLGASQTSGCELMETADGRIRVVCLVEVALLSDGAAAKLGLGTDAEAAIGIRSGSIVEFQEPEVDAVFDSLAHHASLADPDGYDESCKSSPDRVARSTRFVVFDEICAEFLSTYVEEFDVWLGEQDIASAQGQYDVSCARCHGADLSGTSGRGPTMLDEIAVGINDERKFIFISEGGSHGMPVFPRLTTDQIDALIAFIRDAQG